MKHQNLSSNDHSSPYKSIQTKRVEIIGVSVHEGQGHRGAELAPDQLRQGGLIEVAESLGWKIQDSGNISNKDLNVHEAIDSTKPETVRNGRVIGAMCKKLNEMCYKSAMDNNFTMVLGGDHGLATGSISGLKDAYPDLKVIWVDAHGDCNTPEASHSGNYHGMPCAHLLGWFENPVEGFEWFKPVLKPEDIVYIGLRDVDDFEKKMLKKHNIKVFDMDDVTEMGIGKVMEETLSYLNPTGSKNPIHLTFDIDGIDPQYAWQTGTKARGGLSYREAHYLIRRLVKTGQLVSMDLVEINTELDKDVPNRQHFHGDNKLITTDNETVYLGIELLGSALGHRICL